jgi:Protein of unknown function (DUF3987)
MQCPVEYVAVSAIVLLGVVLGETVGIRPKEKDDWILSPNFWGINIGPPSIMKSPPLEEVLKPLKNLERLAWEAYEVATEVYEQELEGWQEAKKEDPATAGPKPVKPTAKRYLTQDPSYEQLGVMMAGNSAGILLHRDELIFT